MEKIFKLSKSQSKPCWLIKIFVLGFFALGFGLQASAQLNITGKVSESSTGESLPGVNVFVKGTLQGVVSDVNGNYSINAPNEESVLMFSFVGFITQEIMVGSQQTINVSLEDDSKQIEEVVVVGYGTQRKANLTGSVATVNAQELTSRTAPNTVSLLQGRVAGLQVIQNSAMPGMEQVELRIRGLGSYGSTNNPLILIDGIEADLSKVNPNMIESVTVLKDASSSAIYGARAANGVILVTTKSGKEGKLRVEYTYHYSQQRPSTPMERITNSVEFMEMTNKAIDFSAQQTGWYYTKDQIDRYRNGQAAGDFKQYPNCDWLDYLLRNGYIKEHFLNVYGGKDGTTINAGLGYLDQQGLLLATAYRRYDFQLNLKTKLSSKVTFGSNINMNYGKRWDTTFDNVDAGKFDNLDASRDQLRSAYAGSPLMTPQLPDGSGRYSANGFASKGGNKNPIAQANEGGGMKQDINYILASSYINWEIIPGLNAEVKGGVRFEEKMVKATNSPWELYSFLPNDKGEYLWSTAQGGGFIELRQRNSRTKFYTLYGTLNYQKTFLDVHHFNVLAGYSMELYQNEWMEGYRRDYSDPNIMWYLKAGPSDGQTNLSDVGEWALMSYFGRMGYDYQNKYILEFNMRFDGSSRLHPSTRWGFFPSISAGWRISEEDFFNVDFVNSLKLRGSWGVGGNYGSDNYQYQALLASDASGIEDAYSIGGKRVPFYYANKMINDKIKWETTTTSNIGLDFAIWGSRIFGEVDYFYKYTKDIIRDLQVPKIVGVSGPKVNHGEMKNTGWEFLLGHNNRVGDVRYGIKINLDTYTNTLVKYGNQEIGSQTIKREGLPYDSYYLLQMEGIYQNDQEILDHNVKTPYAGSAKIRPGDIKYKDVSGPNDDPDGQVDVTYDRVVMSGAFPKFSYGINLNAEYKGFDLSVFFQGVQGKKLYIAGFGMTPFNQAAPPFAFWRNAWDGEGTSNTLPHIFISGYAPIAEGTSSFFLHNASYLRMKNIQIGYNVPLRYTQLVYMQGLRVYVSGDNLLTFTKYFDGQLDPERTGRTGDSVYPQARILSFGLKVTF